MVPLGVEHFCEIGNPLRDLRNNFQNFFRDLRISFGVAGPHTDVQRHDLTVAQLNQRRTASASFYGADQKLMVQQSYSDSLNNFGVRMRSRGAYQEYWYDALGRRVLVRSRVDSLCLPTSWCFSSIERYVWDGVPRILTRIDADNSSGRPKAPAWRPGFL